MAFGLDQPATRTIWMIKTLRRATANSGENELYAEGADWMVFGRISGPGRRGFLKGAGLAAMSAALGASIPIHRNMPAGLIPGALADERKGS